MPKVLTKHSTFELSVYGIYAINIYHVTSHQNSTRLEWMSGRIIDVDEREASFLYIDIRQHKNINIAITASLIGILKTYIYTIKRYRTSA